MAASSSVTSVGGMLIVTQVIPQDGGDASAIPLHAATGASPTDAQATPLAFPAKKDVGNGDYQRGEIPGLGVVQVVIGLLCVLFSLTAISHFLLVHVAFCGGVWFVASGWLALAAHKRTSVTLMWACLCANAVSILLSLGGVALLIWLLPNRWSAQHICGEQLPGEYAAWSQCVDNLSLLSAVLQALRGLVLALLVVQAAVCVALCVFITKAIRTRSHYAPIVQLGRGGGCCGGGPEAN